MNNQCKLFYANSLMEKQALQVMRAGLSGLRSGAASAAQRAPGFIADLANRNDFIGGLTAPITKLIGGAQKTYGLAQKGVAGLQAGGKATLDDVYANPLYTRGAKNMQRGAVLREQSGLQHGLFGPGRSLGYRAGRGLGMVGIGAPIAMAPFTLSTYAGAASADPAVATEHAKNMALQRFEDRMAQFEAMPFLERIQTAWNPEKFTSQLNMPEATDLTTAMAENNINNPGIMKYLSSFNPFLANPENVISQKVRAEIMNALGQKNASEKEASLALWKNLRSGLMPMLRRYTASSSSQLPAWKALLNRGVSSFSKAPVRSLAGGVMAATTPFGMYMSYKGGQNSVYNQAAQDARALTDIQMHNVFNSPGFMAGAGRFGAAIAPGLTKDMLLRNIRQSMFPTQQ